MSDNAYEQAVTRFEAARRNYPLARAHAEQIVNAATDEYNTAEAALRECEERPGIPRAEYRRPLAAACSDLHGDDRTRTPHYHAEARS